jgi:hypothetical protein
MNVQENLLHIIIMHYATVYIYSKLVIRDEMANIFISLTFLNCL